MLTSSPIDKVAAAIAVRYPCTYTHAKYVLNLARELNASKAEEITERVLSVESRTNSGAACRILEQLVREKQFEKYKTADECALIGLAVGSGGGK